MKKRKIIGNTLIVVGLLLLTTTLLTDIVVPLLSIAGVIITCIGFIYFLIFGDVHFVESIYHFTE